MPLCDLLRTRNQALPPRSRLISLAIMHHPIVNPDVPHTKGPYSQIIRLDQLLFVSGQASTDPVTGAVVDGNFDVQARQAFENLSAALRAAGSSLEHVVKTTVFLCDAANFPATSNMLLQGIVLF